MKVLNFKNVMLLALAAGFLAGGIWLMSRRQAMRSDYETRLEEAAWSAENPDRSALEEMAAEQAALETEIADMTGQLEQLQQDTAELDRELEQLRQNYEQLTQEEDTVYYQTVLQALTEGVRLVESYISGDE